MFSSSIKFCNFIWCGVASERGITPKTNHNRWTVFFGVYRCWGPGAAALRGVSWARELNYDSAHKFLAKSFVNGRHWIAPSDA
ncbi:putative pectinesterase [Helianthus anomalus]